MAGTEIKDAVKNTSEHIVSYVKDVATLTVATRTAEVGVEGLPTLVARTVISFDGDNDTVVPTQRNEGGQVVVDTTLYEIHMQNVAAAIDYRTRLLDSMIGFLKSRIT